MTHWTATYELVYLGFAMMTTYRALSGSTPDGTGDDAGDVESCAASGHASGHGEVER